jgi:hypothetical protein
MKQSLIITSFLAGTLLNIPAYATDTARDEHLNQIVKRGADVMPFDLEKTTHVFSKTKQGGIQQVIVKDSKNDEQIKLIRQHLLKISAEFKKGDFSNPAKIHGKDMPGLNVLRNTSSKDISFAYKELTNGAQINYTSKDIQIIKAIHQWFDAQLSDHARHAVAGHENHLHQSLNYRHH